MAGFGSFMEGMQGGMRSMDQLKDSRLKRKLYDQVITESEAELEGKDFSRARRNLPAIKRFSSSDTLLGKLSDKLDPVLSRFMERLGKEGGSATGMEMELDPSLQPAIPELDPSQFEAPEYEFADGTAGGLGDWIDDDKPSPKKEKYAADSKEEIAKRAERARAGSAAPARSAIPESVVDRSGDKTLAQRAGAKAKDAAKYKGYGLASPEGAGKLSRAGRFLGRVAAPYAIAGAGAGGIRGALDAEQPGESVLGDTWERAKGAGKGVVAGLLNPTEAIFGGGEDPAEAPVEEAVPTGSSGPTNPRRYPGQGAARTAAPAPAPAAPEAIPSAAPAEADPLAGFDVSKIPPEQIPNFSNRDWEAHRGELLDDYIMNGMSYAEAWDKVDQQVVATQQRGFMHFGKQALVALGEDGKYTPAAAAAVRAAFQYLPSTTDVQVGNYNGRLVAFSVDEESGEQVGQPMVVTPELLQKVLMNFQDPKVWAEYAQDNRKLDQADRGLDQTDTRIGLAEQGLEIERENAKTNRMRAIGGEGEGGMKLTDADRHTQFWQDQSFAAAQDDPELQAAMAAVMASLYVEDGGNTRPEVISRQVASIAKTPEGRAKILAAANQYAGG
jgi:hypothetical protein